MTRQLLKYYLLNCFLLTVPVMLWNVIFSSDLPALFQPGIFWKDIPAWLTYVENGSRILIFLLTALMPLKIKSRPQKTGLYVYLAGIFLYFASWLLLICFPVALWTNYFMVIMAPAYTPLIWLIGISLIGDSFYFKLPYRSWFFILVSLVFLVFHNFHTALIYFRMN